MTLEEYLAEADMRARRFSGAYTGTSGTLAGYVVNLVKIVRQLLKGVAGMGYPEDFGLGFDTRGATGPPGYSGGPPMRPTGPREPLSRTVYSAPAEASQAADVADDINPKDRIGTDKLPLDLWPAVATAEGSIALLNGALKYGRNNWRVTPIRATIYAAALARHMAKWMDGEECDEEGIPHLGSALACLAILVDAKAAGTLNDDRNIPGGVTARFDELTGIVRRLRARPQPSPAPKDWTIADAPAGQGTKVH